jgi:hypothetical protein
LNFYLINSSICQPGFAQPTCSTFDCSSTIQDAPECPLFDCSQQTDFASCPRMCGVPCTPTTGAAQTTVAQTTIQQTTQCVPFVCQNGKYK